MGPEAYADIGKIGKKYGDIFSIKMGSYWYVVLNDFNIIKNALKDDIFTGRPNYLLRMSFYKKGECDLKISRKSSTVILNLKLCRGDINNVVYR